MGPQTFVEISEKSNFRGLNYKEHPAYNVYFDINRKCQQQLSETFQAILGLEST